MGDFFSRRNKNFLKCLGLTRCGTCLSTGRVGFFSTVLPVLLALVGDLLSLRPFPAPLRRMHDCPKHICPKWFVSFARRNCIYCPKELYLLPEGIVSIALRNCICCPKELYLLPEEIVSIALRNCIYCPKELYLLLKGIVSFAQRNCIYCPKELYLLTVEIVSIARRNCIYCLRIARRICLFFNIFFSLI